MKKVIPIEVENAICPQRWDFPYINMNRGEVKMCCLASSYTLTADDIEKHGKDSILNNDYNKARRLEMLKGIRHSDCKYCWDLEDKNIDSPRQSHYKINEGYSKTRTYLLDNWSEDIDINDDILVSRTPSLLELVIDSTCDMKCMYCSPRYSTQWATESLKNKTITISEYKEITREISPDFESLMWDWIANGDGSHIKVLRVSGGEPLIIPEFYKVIDNVKNNRSITDISVITNGNAKEKQFDKFIDAISNMPSTINFHVTISMESINEQAEYIRTGLDWTRFESNVNKLFEIASTTKHIKIGFNPTLNALSIPRLRGFNQWVVDLEIKYGIVVSFNSHSVKSPECHSIFVLPSEFSKYVDDAIEVLENSPVPHPMYINFLRNIKQQLEHNSPEQRLQREFYDWFRNFDELRELNLVHTFPELKDFYENCSKIK